MAAPEVVRAWGAVEGWFAGHGWAPFPFQREAWGAYLRGESGLIHAPTGVGKTLAAFVGPVLERGIEGPWDRGSEWGSRKRGREEAEPVRVLWLTPMRALASDTVLSMMEVVEGLGLPWSIEKRTGDTAGSLKKKQRERLPTVLVTTPESLSLLLSYPECRERFATLRCVVIDEWHELIGTKRGVQTELCLARLRGFAPGVRTWGVSATLGNLEEAACVLLGPGGKPAMVRGELPKAIEVRTLIPTEIERFPWAGHLGLRVLPQVLDVVEKGAESKGPNGKGPKGQRGECRDAGGESGGDGGGGGATLVFTNTRSQAEIWFRRVLIERPGLLGAVAIHHGSLDRDLRAEVEGLLSDARLKCVVCTSSLDLGVDFSPVERIVQVGSPKGVARLLQRAGRSGHRPGAVSRIYGAPTHALELVEFAAARDAVARGEIEGRRPLERCLDVLVQHMVTVAAGGGFVEEELKSEVMGTWAFRGLSEREWAWCMDFVRRGGESLRAYPQYARVRGEGSMREWESGVGGGNGDACTDGILPPALSFKEGVVADGAVRWVVASDAIAKVHRMGIGTISSDVAMQVRVVKGVRTTGGTNIGTIEESFIARLAVGDRFMFSGRILELVKVRGMVVYARPAQRKSGVVPTWGGGRFPLSTRLAAAVRRKIEEARLGAYDGPEMEAVRPVLELQRAWSAIPAPDELLVETVRTRDGHHIFVFPFDGRNVHEGLGALVAYRLTKREPRSVTATANDYGFELLSPDPIELDEGLLHDVLSPAGLVEDLAACLNSTQMARRQFRDIARTAGLILPGYPGAARPMRYVQASSEMFFEVFEQFDPGNMLLEQARREVLEDQLELSRLSATLERLAGTRVVLKRLERLTPLAFPLWAERLREVHASSETWSDKIAKMVVRLEGEAEQEESEEGKRRPEGKASKGRRAEKGAARAR